MLELFNRNPAEFKRHYVEVVPLDYPAADAVQQLAFGHLVADTGFTDIGVLDVPDRRTNAVKEAIKDNWELGRPTILLHEINELSESARNLRQLIIQMYGPLEPTMMSVNKVSGFDITEVPDTFAKYPIFVQLTNDISSFDVTCFQARYDRKAALWALAADYSGPIIFAVADKRSIPRLGCFELGVDDLALAKNEVVQQLNSLSQHMTTKVQPYPTQPIKLQRPHWLAVHSGVSQNGQHFWGR